MEKLQAALANARLKRTNEPLIDKRSVGPQRTPNADRVDERWEALKTLTPSDKALKQHRVLSTTASEASRHFDIMRTKLLLQMRQNGWKRLAITSPMPKSGKTTLACNLAMGLARQEAVRSILFDLDLRDPQLHSFLDHRPEHAIGALLARKVDFAEHARRIGRNLAICMSNEKHPDPTQSLLSATTEGVIAEIEKSYAPAVMIFDMPSILVSDEARSFLKNVDCALIVTRAGKTRYNQYDRCEREIAEQTNVIGTIVNACRHTGSVPDLD